MLGGAAAAGALALLGLYLLPSPLPQPDPAPVVNLRPAAPVAAPSEGTVGAVPVADPLPAAVAPALEPAKSAVPPQSAPLSEPAEGVVPPRFDLMRVEQDGSALVAGKAVSNSRVSVLVGDIEVATVATDRSGAFVTMFDLAYSAVPRVVTLRMQLPDGKNVVSEEQVILSPANVAVAPAAASTPPALSAALATGTAPEALPNMGPPARIDNAPPVPGAMADAPAAPIQTSLAPAAILIGPDGVKVLQDGGTRAGSSVAQGDIQPVTIETIAYTATGAVQLGGRATAGAAVRLYVNRAFITEMRVGADGAWGGVLPDIAPGIYTLRADQVDAAGNVSARFETPFQRETQASLAALLGPAQQPALPMAPQAGDAPQGGAVLSPAVIGATAPNLALQPIAGPAPDPVAVTQGLAAAPQPAPSLGAAVQSPPSPTAAAQPVGAPVPVSVTVQPGFTLWAIARDRFGDGILYVQVYETNKDRIRNPDLIYPGQVFALPALPIASDPGR
jgi:LysM repeat protein